MQKFQSIIELNNESHSISFEEAMKDSPRFRASIMLFNEELEELVRWLSGVDSTHEHYIETIKSIYMC